MTEQTTAFSDIADIIADLKNGKMIIMVDDEDRENEGDLMIAADVLRDDDVNFMLRHGRGLLCLAITDERCRQLNLPQMVSDPDDELAARFTVSIDAATGVKSGASAIDRARTIRSAVSKYAEPKDLSRPGHVFPLMADVGGVLVRAGHTEAGCDLAGLAGFEPAVALTEILNEDGSMARRADLEVFASDHGIRIGSIADLIEYRLSSERNIERSIIG